MSKSTALQRKRCFHKNNLYKYNQVVFYQDETTKYWYLALVTDITEENKNKKKVDIQRIDPDHKWEESEEIQNISKINVLPFTLENYNLIIKDFPVPPDQIEYHNFCMEAAIEYNKRNEEYKLKVEKIEKKENMQTEMYLPNAHEANIVNYILYLLIKFNKFQSIYYTV